MPPFVVPPSHQLVGRAQEREAEQAEVESLSVALQQQRLEVPRHASVHVALASHYLSRHRQHTSDLQHSVELDGVALDPHDLERTLAYKDCLAWSQAIDVGLLRDNVDEVRADARFDVAALAMIEDSVPEGFPIARTV